jgi:hypothetical protein
MGNPFFSSKPSSSKLTASSVSLVKPGQGWGGLFYELRQELGSAFDAVFAMALGGITSGDVTVTSGVARVVAALGLPFDPVSFATRPPGSVLTWDGSKIVFAVPGSVPALGITEWSVLPSLVEVGASFAATGTASYAGTPDSVSVLRAGHPPAQALSTPFTSWNYGTLISIPAVLGTEVFTLSAVFGADTKTAVGQTIAGARIYYGASVDPGSYDAAFVTGLGANSLQTSYGIDAQMDTGASNYGFVAIPVPLGTPSNWFVYPNPGSPLYPGGVIQVGSVVVPTNGIDVVYILNRTFNFGLGPINMKGV